LIVDDGEKKVSSTAGHALLDNHPYAAARFANAQKNIENRIGTFWVSGFNMYSNKMCTESFDVETEDKDGEKYNIKIDFKFEVDL
jgi:hypothetical protein